MPYFPAASGDIPPDIASHIVAWARVPEAKAWKHPGAAREWTPVLALDPSNPNRAAMAGFFWLFRNGRVIETHALLYEVVEGRDRPAPPPPRSPG